jgi:hypothetical protein
MTTPAHLVRLMAHVPFRGKLGPEDAEAYAFANSLRLATLEGRLSAVWTHPAQELCHAKGGRMMIQAAKARALGMITGTSDFLFMSGKRNLAIEMKSKTGSLTDPQKDFAAWCRDNAIPYYVARSCDAGLTILAEYGMLVR